MYKSNIGTLFQLYIPHMENGRYFTLLQLDLYKGSALLLNQTPKFIFLVNAYG